MKGLLVGGAGVLVLGGGGLGITASSYVPKVRPDTYVGPVPIGGLTADAAMTKVKTWFNEASQKPLTLTSEHLTTQPKAAAKDLGAKIDLQKTASRLPMEGFWDEVKRKALQEAPAKSKLVPVYSFDEKRLSQLADFIEDNLKTGSPARAFYKEGKVVHRFEAPGMKLDSAKLSESVSQAMITGKPQKLPMITAPKKVPDDALKSIQTVEGSYTTRFNPGQRDRSQNILLAAKIIDGMVLMPGESFSFNERVGRRTAAGGFRRAGVFINGQMDYDIGGGICQVSTTLYNAALLANLEIRKRSSHSRPVPYVALGRDAAVSYPNPDLVIRNNQKRPLALEAQVNGGEITFRILGRQKPEGEISIVRGKTTTRENGVKYVQDDTLGYGVQKVLNAGSSRRTVATYRVMTKDGVEVSRQPLGLSVYVGSPRIIARNTKAKPPVAAPDAAGAGSTEGEAAAPLDPASAP